MAAACETKRLQQKVLIPPKPVKFTFWSLLPNKHLSTVKYVLTDSLWPVLNSSKYSNNGIPAISAKYAQARQAV